MLRNYIIKQIQYLSENIYNNDEVDELKSYPLLKLINIYINWLRISLSI